MTATSRAKGKRGQLPLHGHRAIPKVFGESCVDFLGLSIEGHFSDLPINMGTGRPRRGDATRLDIGKSQGGEAIAGE